MIQLERLTKITGNHILFWPRQKQLLLQFYLKIYLQPLHCRLSNFPVSLNSIIFFFKAWHVSSPFHKLFKHWYSHSAIEKLLLFWCKYLISKAGALLLNMIIVFLKYWKTYIISFSIEKCLLPNKIYINFNKMHLWKRTQPKSK